MYYSKKEEYAFKIPQEHTAYLKFKQNLKDSGIRFVEEGGHTHQTITIRTNGVFYMDENGDIQMK